MRSERPDWGSERPASGLRGFISDLRLDMGSEKPNLGSERSNVVTIIMRQMHATKKVFYQHEGRVLLTLRCRVGFRGSFRSVCRHQGPYPGNFEMS